MSLGGRIFCVYGKTLVSLSCCSEEREIPVWSPKRNVLLSFLLPSPRGATHINPLEVAGWVDELSFMT